MAHTQVHIEWDKTKDEAWCFWATCESCGYHGIGPGDNYCGGCGGKIYEKDMEKQPGWFSDREATASMNGREH